MNPKKQTKHDLSLWDSAMLMTALKDSIKKLNPLVQLKNPVMFVVYIGSIFCTILSIIAIVKHQDPTFVVSITLWLWFTVLFANYAEAYAEGRSKAQSESLKGLKKHTEARLIKDGKEIFVNSETLKKGDVILVKANEIIPNDGEVIEGVASVDESAITGESAPVIRAAGSDFCSVTGGTTVVSDWLRIRINANAGESFLDQMIGMVENAKRQKTPNEIALTILLVTLTIIFLIVVITLYPYAVYSGSGAGHTISITALIALLVCLIPTTIGGLLSAIGVAGMSRMMAANVIATSGRAVETAGNIDVLLLDKTGTITFGNRQASDFYPAKNIDPQTIGELAWLSSQADETPEGRSIVALAKQQLNQNELPASYANKTMTPIEFTAQTRMSGMDIALEDAQWQLRKGAAQAIEAWLATYHETLPSDVMEKVEDIATQGATPLVIAEVKVYADKTTKARVIGTVALRDIVKPNIRERFAQLREMGIKTVMITGDNPLTATAIASEAGVDDFLAEATPEGKLKMIRDYQAQGLLVAMTGDGTNDAPALAQADVAVAMNSGTQAAKEAGNMVDLDSDPTKLIEIVQTGKQLLMTRGALTTFSIANDLAKYFAIIPALFISIFPSLGVLNIMHLASPNSAILSAVIFNALIIIVLIPLAIKGVKYVPESANRLLRKNLLIYGLGGVIVPFIGIKAIDLIINSFMSI